MNLNDSYPLDYTGYGPTGIGNAPTAREMRAQAMNRFRTDRMSQAMQYIDPSLIGAASAARRMVHGKAASPDEMRRSLFETAGGQAALDMAQLGRRTGYLGQGDPVNYAANISRGVAGGGFLTSVGGTQNGRSITGSPAMTSGSGAIAERVSMNFMKGMMTDLYGKGNTNPSKMYGFDMEETSQVFSTLARRGVIGHAAHIERNADVNTRLGAAAKSALHPSVRAALGKINLAGETEQDKEASLDKMISNAEDGSLLKKELTAIRKSSDAVIVNDDERRRVSALVKTVTKGLASLSDVYGELSAPELMQKLESVSGLRITNKSQAKQATQMVENLRGAAIISGMDPRAFMQFSGDMQARLQGQVGQVFGFDQRSGTQAAGVTGAMHNQFMTDAFMEAKVAQGNVKRLRSNGVATPDARSGLEIYADKVQTGMTFAGQFKGITHAMGGMDTLTGKSRDDAMKLLEEFENTSDPKERHRIEQQMQNVIADHASTPGNRRSFQNVFDSDTGTYARSNAMTNPQNASRMERMRSKAANEDTLNGFLFKNLANAGIGGGIKGATAVGKQMLDMGGGTIASLLDVSKDDSGNKRKRQKDFLASAGLKGAEADKFLDNFFDATGAEVNGDALRQGAGDMQRSGRGRMGTGDKNALAIQKLAAMESGSLRHRIRDSDKKVGIKGISQAIFDGSLTGFNDQESVQAALEAMANDEIKMEVDVMGEDGKLKKIDLAQTVATDINFADGLNEADLKKLDRVNGGKKIELYKKMIDPTTGKHFKSRKALIAATQGDAGADLRHDAIKMLKLDERLNVTGGPESMSAMTDKNYQLAINSGLDERAQAMAGAQYISAAMGLETGTKNALITDAADGNGSDGGMFEASKFKVNKGFFGGAKFDKRGDGSKIVNLPGSGFRNIMKMSDAVGSASGKQMQNISAMDGSGNILEQMESQLASMKEFKKAAGGDDVLIKMPSGEKDRSLDESIKELASTIKRMKNAEAEKEGNQVVNEMRVTTLKIEGSFDPSGGD